MTKPETLLDYGRRVARVSDHIAEHLDDELDVERLAEVAHFSPWHFHRIYRETTGETVADTVRRLRLHRAAVDLTRDDDPLERVAKRAGYGEWLPKSGEEAGARLLRSVPEQSARFAAVGMAHPHAGAGRVRRQRHDRHDPG
jgi:AraC-like DNA-binding protein